MLDYHINAYAKGLKNNRTYTVAVILPNLLNPFSAWWHTTSTGHW